MIFSAKSTLLLESLKADHDELENKLEKIFSNLYYTWDKDLYEFIDELDSFDWRKTKSPSVIIHRYIEEGHNHSKEGDKNANIEKGLESLKEYLEAKTWYEENAKSDEVLKKFSQNPVLYFSAEFGLVDWLQIYSGGLGVLAGDFVKQVSDHGFPLVGIGIFYHEGYFHQDIDHNGMQKESYIPQDPAASMLKLVRDRYGDQVEIKVRIDDHDVYVRAWDLKVGRNSIYLLDTDFWKNERYEDRMITAHLYGGDNDTRIRQEIVLGIGGYRLAKKLGIDPGVLHLNEGHASFVILERMAELKEQYPDPKERFEAAKEKIMFTNHTLNPAGNDKFDYDLISKYLGYFAKNLGIDISELFKFGVDERYAKGAFSMTILGLKGAKISNAVSQLHGQAAQRVWPDYSMEAVTNGVHMPTFVSKPVQELIEKYVDKNWKNPIVKTDWNKIDNIPDEELWSVHKELKKVMIQRVNSTLGSSLDPNKLTIIWTRRFAAYKRPDVVLNDLAQLSEIVNNIDQPVQLLIGGKAHPRDVVGKGILQRVIRTTMDDEFKNKVVFLNGYNWNLARYMVAGTDVWLNNPIRFEEASGTSGMKAGANGILQFTTLDGWTDEVDWSDKGWIIPQEDINNEIYRIVRNELAPTYYEGDFPIEWVQRMKKTMKVCLENYNMGRMVEEYIDLYKKII